MAIRQVREKEWTKDGRKWIYETRYNNKTYKSKKYLTKKEAINAEREFLNEMDKKHNPSEMTLGGLFEEHYNYQKDKVKATTLTNYGKKVKHFDSLKNIKLSDLNINHIEKWKKEMNETNLATRTKNDLLLYKKECKKYYGFNEKWFVFGDVNPIHPQTLRTKKNENAEKAGVKQIRIHDFRHRCASLLINNGANVTIVAKYLGHAKIDETLNTYSHIFDNKMDEVVDTINKLNQTNDKS